jgi:2-hydroxy-3-keto-5-methylthiopentenyl-1-phosphate phosphatase
MDERPGGPGDGPAAARRRYSPAHDARLRTPASAENGLPAWGAPSHTGRFFIVCDFDGTITTRDTLDLVVHRWAPEVWETAESRLQTGEIDLHQAMVEEFRAVKATEREVLEFVLRESEVRKGFGEFVAWCESGRHELVVVSAGFRIIIDAILAEAGLSHLHVHAGDALFTSEGAVLALPPSPPGCSAPCSHCKSETIAAHAPFPGPVVYIGDGYSDRCPSEQADVVFARTGLADYLDELGLPYLPFETFDDVRGQLEALLARSRAKGRG